MPRIRTADPAEVAVSGRAAPLSRPAVARAVTRVLRREGREALVSVTFLGREPMRRLNARWKGRPAPTDVIAFSLRTPDGRLAGDVYVCPWAAARHAETLGVPLRRELLRLVVHGVLHVLGYDHPEGTGRTRSAMWRRQERYLRGLR